MFCVVGFGDGELYFVGDEIKGGCEIVFGVLYFDEFVLMLLDN